MTDIYHYDKKKDEQTLIETDTGKRSKEKFIENLRAVSYTHLTLPTTPYV